MLFRRSVHGNFDQTCPLPLVAAGGKSPAAAVWRILGRWRPCRHRWDSPEHGMVQVRQHGKRGNDRCLRTWSERPQLWLRCQGGAEPVKGAAGKRLCTQNRHLHLQSARLLCESKSAFKMEIPAKSGGCARPTFRLLSSPGSWAPTPPSFGVPLVQTPFRKPLSGNFFHFAVTYIRVQCSGLKKVFLETLVQFGSVAIA